MQKKAAKSSNISATFSCWANVVLFFFFYLLFCKFLLSQQLYAILIVYSMSAGDQRPDWGVLNHLIDSPIVFRLDGQRHYCVPRLIICLITLDRQPYSVLLLITYLIKLDRQTYSVPHSILSVLHKGWFLASWSTEEKLVQHTVLSASLGTTCLLLM